MVYQTDDTKTDAELSYKKQTPKQTSFIKGELTFWKCNYCRDWHEGIVHKCPLKEQAVENQKIFKNKVKQIFDEIEKAIKGTDLRFIAEKRIKELKQKHTREK